VLADVSVAADATCARLMGFHPDRIVRLCETTAIRIEMFMLYMRAYSKVHLLLNSETQRRHEAAKRAWRSAPKPDWPGNRVCCRRIVQHILHE